LRCRVAIGKLRGRFGLLEVYGYMNTTRLPNKPNIVQLDGPLLRPEEAARLLAVKTNWIYRSRARRAAAVSTSRPPHPLHAGDAGAMAGGQGEWIRTIASASSENDSGCLNSERTFR
jgi:hypothetical protein